GASKGMSCTWPSTSVPGASSASWAFSTNTPPSDRSRVEPNTSPSSGWVILIRAFIVVRGSTRLLLIVAVLGVSRRSVPLLLSGGALLEALHAPHVLTGPPAHIALDGRTQRGDGFLLVITV